MTLKEILKLLQYSYPRQQFENENVKAYTIMLRDIDLELLELAAFQLIRESVFFPSVAELIGRVADLEIQRQGHLPAIAAYEIAIHGNGVDLRQNYPEILRAIQMSCGDMYNLRTSDNQAADRARFIEAYKEIIKTKRNAIIQTPQLQQFLEAGSGHKQLRESNHVSTNGSH